MVNEAAEEGVILWLRTAEGLPRGFHLDNTARATLLTTLARRRETCASPPRTAGCQRRTSRTSDRTRHILCGEEEAADQLRPSCNFPVINSCYIQTGSLPSKTADLEAYHVLNGTKSAHTVQQRASTAAR